MQTSFSAIFLQSLAHFSGQCWQKHKTKEYQIYKKHSNKTYRETCSDEINTESNTGENYETVKVQNKKY